MKAIPPPILDTAAKKKTSYYLIAALCVLFINFFDKESSVVGGTAGEHPRGRALTVGTFDH